MFVTLLGPHNHDYQLETGRGNVLWHLRILDKTGELQKDFLERSVKFNKSESKARALQQLADLEGWEDLISAIKATDDSLIYERRSMDRLPLKKWSDVTGHVLLIGDGKCHLLSKVSFDLDSFQT